MPGITTGYLTFAAHTSGAATIGYPTLATYTYMKKQQSGNLAPAADTSEQQQLVTSHLQQIHLQQQTLPDTRSTYTQNNELDAHTPGTTATAYITHTVYPNGRTSGYLTPAAHRAAHKQGTTITGYLAPTAHTHETKLQQPVTSHM